MLSCRGTLCKWLDGFGTGNLGVFGPPTLVDVGSREWFWGLFRPERCQSEAPREIAAELTAVSLTPLRLRGLAIRLFTRSLNLV